MTSLLAFDTLSAAQFSDFTARCDAEATPYATLERR